MIDVASFPNVSGHFKLFQTNMNSSDILCVDKKNTIVNGFMEVAARTIWSGAQQTGYGISQFGVGTGSTATNVADTSLEASVLTKTGDGGTQISPTTFRINGTLLADEANDGDPTLITEMGLFSVTGTIMVARVVFEAQDKSAAITFRFEWDITVT